MSTETPLAPPPKPHLVRNFTAVALVAVLVIAVGYFIYEASLQPDIRIQNYQISPSMTSKTPDGANCTSSFSTSLDLVNVGRADGYATLIFKDTNGTPEFGQTYFVPQGGQQVPVNLGLGLVSCTTGTLVPSITMEEKA